MPGPVRVLRVQAGGGCVPATQRAFGVVRPIMKVRWSPDQPDAMPEAHPADARVVRLAPKVQHPRHASPPATFQTSALRAALGPLVRPPLWAPMHTPPRLRGTEVVGRANCTPTLAASPPSRSGGPQRAAQEEPSPTGRNVETPGPPNRPGSNPISAGRHHEKVFQDFFGPRGQIPESPGKVGVLAMNAQVEMRITFWSEWHLPARRG